jgi:hypothetical protein
MGRDRSRSDQGGAVRAGVVRSGWADERSLRSGPHSPTLRACRALSLPIKGGKAPPSPPGREKDQTACKPGSVPPCLRRTRRPFLWTDRCRPVLATYPEPSGRRRPYQQAGAGSLFGLAPGGACHAIPVTRDPVRSYRTLSPLPSPRRRRSALCGAIPRVTPGGRYPPPCRRGARTFLELTPATARPSDPPRKGGETAPGVNLPSLDGEGQATPVARVRECGPEC